ncbi:hypothetical protein [Sphingomonas sp. BAUL-RG-20F-R05-02]|uniref:hypothetical protein n=1 Tax=Sphingomonas sp. BAUL-RG-20F-R05-02 TaxID=2914830 RepID=UPI001F571440|nr:hypothetical protein [Sphingomonas sp. BAUL-RG-20F-R05-02]
MDRDRDEPDRTPERKKSRDLGRDRIDPPSTDKFDMSDWDTPTSPPTGTDPAPSPAPSAVERTRSTADFAQFFKLISSLETGMQRILASFGMIRDLAADSRASVAEAAADAAKRAEEQKARDKLITERLIDPDQLARHAEAGARQGARDALAGTAREWTRQLESDAQGREISARQDAADRAERRADELRRRRQDGWRNGAIIAIALLIPTAYGYGHYGGTQTGEASAYARARDEVAAANWANTPNGKLARQLDQASEQTIPAMAECPEDHGWHSEKADGRRWCYGFSKSAKMVSGWALP